MPLLKPDLISARRLLWLVFALFIALGVFELLRPTPRLKSSDPLIAAPASPLTPPASPGSLAGAAIGEPLTRPSGYTNEMLHQDLEAQKTRMGITDIVMPSPQQSYLEEAMRRLRSVAGVQKLTASPSPAPLAGTTPSLLTKPADPKTP